MTAVIDSLKIEGNIPCPTPSYAKTPIPRQKSLGNYQQNPSARPVRLKANATERHVNTEEELKNILLQAKAPAFNGPTPLAKRMGYFTKIKELNDGMYRHNIISEQEPKGMNSKELTLEGKKMDSSQKDDSTYVELRDLLPNEEVDGNFNGLPHRPIKSSHSAKSAKSFASVKSAKSDSINGPRPIMLPMLTIGADRHKTQGEYMAENKEINDIHSINALIGSNKDLVKSEQPDEYEFRFQTPRRLRLRGDTREGKSPERTGNYDSLSLTDLKACLHVNHSQEKVSDQKNIIQDYMTQIKTKHPGVKVNPYKMLKVNARYRASHHQMSSRYEFKTVDSYLHFNKNKSNSGTQAPAPSRGQTSANNHTHSDTLLLQMMTEINTPRQAVVTACRLSDKDKNELLQIKPPLTDRSSRHKRQNSYDSSAPLKRSNTDIYGNQQEKEIIQHIVYVPSGQTAKVRLIQSGTS